MQSSAIDSFASLPTQDTEISVVSSPDRNGVSKTDIELNGKAHVHTALASAHAYVAQWKRKWRVPRKCDSLYKKTCIIYTLILAAVWLLNTIPIIVFYAISTTVCWLALFAIDCGKI